MTGQCLCGDVRYTLQDGLRLRPYACHCTTCQARTGTAFSEHMLFQLSDLELTGELDEGHYDMPSGAHSTIYGCVTCKARIYAVNSSSEGMGSLRCGTLDNSSDVIPAAHIWYKSRQRWFSLKEDAPAMDEQPRDWQGWVDLVGLA